MVKSFSGFTLIELIVVLTMLAVLAMTAVPYAQFSFIREKEEEFRLALSDIRRAIGRWRADCERELRRHYGNEGINAVPEELLYPPDIGSLTKSGVYVIKYPPVVPNFEFYHPRYLNQIPKDPFVGADVWTQHYASGTISGTTTYWSGKIIEDVPGTLLISSGVMDVSGVASWTLRRGFVVSLNGTNFSDW